MSAREKSRGSFRRGAVALVLLLLAGAVALFFGVPASGVGAKLAEVASSRLGVTLSEGRVSFSLLEGLVLEDGVAEASTEGRLYRLELPRVVFALERRSLLAGVADVRAIRFERPRIELVELGAPRAGGGAREADAPKSLLALRVLPETVVLEDASVHLGLGDEEEAFSTLEGVTIRLEEVGLSGSGPLALEGSGSLTARSARLGGLDVMDARADLNLHDGNVSLTLLKFRTGLAPFVAEMRVELDRAPFGYDVSSLGEPFDAAPLAGAPAGSLGEASLLIEVFGRGPAPDGFRAQGSLTLPEGPMGEIPALAALNRALGSDVFRPADRRSETLVVYRVRDGYVLFEPFELASGEAAATVRGRAYLDGKLELEVEVRAENITTTTRFALRGTVAEPAAGPVP